MSNEHHNSKKTVSPARRAAYAGLLAALSCVLLYLLYLLPTMRLSLLFVLSLLPVTLAYERRFTDAALSFAAAAVLSGLLFPAQGAWILYAVFFGWYGIAREYIVTKLNRVWSWVVLALLFNIAFFSLFILSYELLSQMAMPGFLKSVPFLGSVPLPALLIPVAEIAFVLFELLFGVCRDYYIRHVRKLLFSRG